MASKKLSLDSLRNPTTTIELAQSSLQLGLKCLSLEDAQIPLKQFIDWRKNEIIPPSLNTYEKGKRNKIELNFYEYVWLRKVSDLRLLGISYNNLKSITNALWQKVDVAEEIRKYRTSDPDFSILEGLDDKNEFVERVSKYGDNDLHNISLDSDANSLSYFESLVSSLFWRLSECKVIIRYDGFINYFGNVRPNVKKTKQELLQEEDITINYLPQPHLSVGLRKYLEGFISDDSKESFLAPLGIINENERELLEVIRKGNLKELTVKFDRDSKTMSSYELKHDGDLSAEQSSEIKKYLALNDYQSITFKSKNNKTVYFEKEYKKEFYIGYWQPQSNG